MAKYRRKPGIIDAVQWTGDNFGELTDFMHDDYGVVGSIVTVTTIHGQATTVVIGDWIIKEPDGKHFYPCKPDIFEDTYELVE